MLKYLILWMFILVSCANCIQNDFIYHNLTEYLDKTNITDMDILNQHPHTVDFYMKLYNISNRTEIEYFMKNHYIPLFGEDGTLWANHSAIKKKCFENCSDN